MRQAGPSSARPPAPAPTPTATEVVTRPEPGLARGKWEAPAWVFWVLLGLVLVGTVLVVAHRMGYLRLRRAAPASSSVPPPSRRGKK